MHGEQQAYASRTAVDARVPLRSACEIGPNEVRMPLMEDAANALNLALANLMSLQRILHRFVGSKTPGMSVRTASDLVNTVRTINEINVDTRRVIEELEHVTGMGGPATNNCQ